MLYKRIIQLELNELSHTLLTEAVKKYPLPHFERMLDQFAYYQTDSETKYEHIEPWIIWTNAHTGKSFDEHAVFRLSDSENLTHPQLWESLSQHGYESLILGCINARRGQTKGGIFFPDPWTKQGKTYPDALQPLFDFISSKVQTHATKKLSFCDLWRGFQGILGYHLPLSFYLKVFCQLVRQKCCPKKRWRLVAHLDEMLAYIFTTLLKRQHFSFNVLFLNAIAHYQHHYWRNHDSSGFDEHIVSPDAAKNDDPIRYGLTVYDKIIGRLLDLVKNEPDTLLLIATGFSQEPFTQFEAQGGMNYYRLKSHRRLIDLLGFQDINVFPLMSRDWQIEACDEAQLDLLYEKLSSLKIEQEPLFFCKKENENHLFIETQVMRSVTENADVKDSDGHALFKFYDFFSCTAIKSGHHISRGSLWTSHKIPDFEHGHPLPITALYSLSLNSITGDDLESLSPH